MNVIPFPSARDDKTVPHPEFCTIDQEGRPMFRFLADYECDDRIFGISFWAYDMADAERRVAAMRMGLGLQGQIFCRL